MQASSENVARGRRMREAAKALGLTSARVGERLGVEDGTVRGWWRGRSMPSLERLRAYAALVGVPVDHLVGGERTDTVQFVTAAPAADVLDLMRLLLDRIALGESASAAYDAVIGRPEDLSPGERRSFDRRSPGLRELILREAGRPWQELSEADRRHLVERLIAQEDARAAHTGPQDDDEP